MTDFDKLAYWKQRIRDHLHSLFDDTSRRMRDIRSETEYLGVTKEQFDAGLKKIGEGYDMIDKAVGSRLALKRKP